MDRRLVSALLRELLKDQIRSVGRVAARYAISDEALWEISKEFDCGYQRARRKLRKARGDGTIVPRLRWLRPHPGLLYLLEKLEREELAERRRIPASRSPGPRG